MTSLDERIAAAFADGATSSGVADLIKEAEDADISSAEATETARTRALDPALSAADVATARREMEDASFNRDRMQEAVRRLGERLCEVKTQEEQARRQAGYDAALVERDALAVELAEVYPPIEAQLADLLARIEMSNARIERINARGLPIGAERLLVAELVARGLPGFVQNSVEVTRITKQVRLPAFRYSQFAPFAWPRSR